MIYQSTHHINFAQGEMAMFSTYIGWALINSGMPYWAAFFLTIIIAFLLGAAIERFIVRHVDPTSVLSVVAVFIGLLFIINSLAGWIFSHTIKTFPSPFPKENLFGNTYVSSHELGGDWHHPGGPVVAVPVFPLHFTGTGHARRGTKSGVQPAGRHSRRLDARAGLGPWQVPSVQWPA